MYSSRSEMMTQALFLLRVFILFVFRFSSRIFELVLVHVPTSTRTTIHTISPRKLLEKKPHRAYSLFFYYLLLLLLILYYYYENE